MSTDSESYIPVHWILPNNPSGYLMWGRVLAADVLTVNDVEVVPGVIHVEVSAGDVLFVGRQALLWCQGPEGRRDDWIRSVELELKAAIVNDANVSARSS